MSKFRRKTGKGQPAISTASLPDIVFMLLFFFMVTTVMREVTLLIENSKPFATEILKLEKRSLVSYVYVGKPKSVYQAQFGTEARIQLNDQLATLNDIGPYIIEEREAKSEAERPQMTVSIKADKAVKMGLITDLKLELRKAQALKINYSTNKGEPFGMKR